MMDPDCTCQDLYCPEPATVLTRRPLTALEQFFEVRLDSGRDLGHWPGQFVEVSVPGIGEAPISVSSSPTQRGAFQMVVRRVGNVSHALHRLQVGQKIGIRGPFGTRFPVDTAMQGRDLEFVCGGIGLVPVRSAIRYVLDHRADYGRITILFGAKSPAELLFLDEAAEWRRRTDLVYRETVDRPADGWKGPVGVITTLLPPLRLDPARTVAVVCGPPIMYKFVLMELRAKQINAHAIYVSLERHMKCGVGKCGHCQINKFYVCQDGPVFRYSDVAGAREAL